MGDDLDPGGRDPELGELGPGEALVDLAGALPGDDLDVGLGGHPRREVLVGEEDDLVDTERLDDVDRVGGGAADVGFGLHLGRRVDVGDDRRAGMLVAEPGDVVGGDGLRQRAAGPEVGDQHGLVGVEDLGRLGHEVHAGHDDDVGVGLRGHPGQLERVAPQVGDAVEDVGRHVVVGEHDRVAAPLQLADLRDDRFEDLPFDLGDDPLEGVGRRRVGGGDGDGHVTVGEVS